MEKGVEKERRLEARMRKEIIKKLNERHYLRECFFDIVLTLLAYYFLGFEIALLVLLAFIAADIAMIMMKLYE